MNRTEQRILTWGEMEEGIRKAAPACVFAVAMNGVPSVAGMVRLVIGAKTDKGGFPMVRQTLRPIDVYKHVTDVANDLFDAGHITEAGYVSAFGDLIKLDWAAKCAAREVERRLVVERLGVR